MQGTAFERQEAAPVPHIGSLLTHTPRGCPLGRAEGSAVALPLRGGGRRGRLSYLLCRGPRAGSALAPSPAAITPAAITPAASCAAMMPRCRNGRGGSPLFLGLPPAARLRLGSFSRALRPVLPALVGGPESSRLCTPGWCCSGCFPSWLRTGNFCLALSVGTFL